MQNLKFRYQSQIKIKHFALKHISQIIFYFPKFKILSFYFFKKSTIWGTFSKTFCDWYLRFRGTPLNYRTTPYIYIYIYISLPDLGGHAYQWNPLKKYSTNSHRLSFFEGDLVYFVHSYIPVSYDKKIISSCIEYGNDLLHTSVESDQIMGFQFHPEKSGEVGIKILDKLIRRL